MTAGGAENSAGGLLGRLATSRSGRDTGAVYLVIGTVSATVVLVADGRHRSVARPKRKNVKHLEFGASAPAMVERLTAGPPLTDEEVRAVIAAVAAPSGKPDG
jgi:large subunit ribosomal protein L14e